MRLASRLLLFDYVTSLLGGNATELRDSAKKVDLGRRADGQSHYYSMFDSWGARVQIDQSHLAEYDMNVLAVEEHLGRLRPGFRFTYFQYLAALYSEIYLHKLAGDPSGLLRELRAYREKEFRDVLTPVTADDLRSASFWMATGSGKTLLAHVNLIQFQHYQPFTPDNILLLTPSATLSNQHLEALADSGIPARHALTSGNPTQVQVLEITKLYVDRRDSETHRGGESLPTSAFDGQNLLLVDEGHKGSTTKGDQAEERKWRDIRHSLAGERGFTFEYSATFAQITETNDELLDEYGKSILFDYGYQHFWGDGYGKDYRVVNLKKEGAYDVDELLLAGLLVLYEQTRYYADHPTEVAEYNLEAPLMVFIGATVTGAVDSEVLQVVQFLDRVLTDSSWAKDTISMLLAGTSSLPSDLFTHTFPYLDRLGLSAADTYQELCRTLFHGRGRLELHMVQRAEGEIGMRTADAAKDMYCGVINVGNASGFIKNAEQEGLTRGEDDHITESVFRAIGRSDSTVNFLVGSKKFIEGWSSWRVSVMGLLKVGRTAGPQVIQLFGRGVRLKGKGMQLRRSSHLLGSHPGNLSLLETIHIFGLRADYMEAFNEAVRREGVPPPVHRTLPITIRQDLGDLALQAPDAGDYSFFEDEVIVFDPEELVEPVEIDLMPTFTTAEGIAEHARSKGSTPPETTGLPLDMIDHEALYLDVLAFKRRRGWFNTYVTRTATSQFLREKVAVAAPKGLFAESNARTAGLAQTAAAEALRKGLERFVYVQQRLHETRHLQPALVSESHPNFPTVRTSDGSAPGYRLEIPEDLVKQVDDLIAELAAGRADLENLAEPLPRLHLDAHLYNPLLLRESDVDERGQQQNLFQPVSVRSVPSGLVASEVRFIRDLREFWAANQGGPAWQECSIYLLRNLARRGVGFFQTAGFYPDFMLWLKRGDSQALAFVEPHGLVIWDSKKVALLQDIRGLGMSVPTVAYIVTPTKPRSIGAVDGTAAGIASLREQHVLLQDDPTYIETILDDLLQLLDSVAHDQYQLGHRAGRFRLIDGAAVGDTEVGSDERHQTHVPLYSLEAAAGHFGSGEAVDTEGWLGLEGPVTSYHFVARVRGRSMEPLIEDGDLVLFRKYQGGSRQGNVVLVQWAGPEDPETGGSYAVKRYHREGVRGDDSGLRIELRSENPEFDPIVLNPRYEDEVGVLAEFVEVLRPPR